MPLLKLDFQVIFCLFVRLLWNIQFPYKHGFSLLDNFASHDTTIFPVSPPRAAYIFPGKHTDVTPFPWGAKLCKHLHTILHFSLFPERTKIIKKKRQDFYRLLNQAKLRVLFSFHFSTFGKPKNIFIDFPSFPRHNSAPRYRCKTHKKQAIFYEPWKCEPSTPKKPNPI